MRHYYHHGYDLDDHRVGGSQPDTVRASNADRDAAAERLRTHHAAGRLTDDEFQQRLEQSMAARTLGELRALGADLPPDEPQPDARAARGRGWRGPIGLRRLPLVLLVTRAWSALGGAAARHGAGYGAWHHGYPGYHVHHGPWFPWPLVLLAIAGFVALRRRARYARFMRRARYWGGHPRWV